ncbi:MAG: hypothetical protein NZ839_01070, partial [Endomicrobia bacterium]|nr:hypothetical protein [Endomicrobiia bacterium]
MIDLIKIINLISAIFCFVLSIVVLQCKKCNFKNIEKINFAVFLLSFTTGLWSANMALQLFFINNIKLGDFLNRFNWCGGLIVASYTFLSLVMAKHYKKADVLGIIQFIVAVLFIGLAFTDYGIKKVISIFPLKR